MSGNGIADVTQEAFDGLMNQMGSQYEAPYILLDSQYLTILNFNFLLYRETNILWYFSLNAKDLLL